MLRRFATMKDIARSLDISVSTVSRALRDAYNVSSKTKRDVLKVAKDLNYKPNYNATGLVKGSTHNIGVILPFITNYYFSTVISGIQEAANSHGYNIFLFITKDSPETELQVTQNLFITSLDGLLVCISSNTESFEHFQRIIDNGTPIVFFDRVCDSIGTSRVVQDDFNGAYEAVDHLIKSGYRKIAHIAGPEHLIFTQKRKEGFLSALKKHGLPINPEWMVHSGFSQMDGESDALKLISGKEMPDAIFAVNDRKAVGAILILKSKNIRVGEDIGVIGFTNDPISSIISPSLTTIAEPAFEIGTVSCELLLNHIKKKNFIAEERILSGKLIVRESTQRKRHKAQ